MITTMHVQLGWADDATRVTAASHQLEIRDPRILLAAHRVLLDMPGVVGADLVSAAFAPYFVVAWETQSGTGSWEPWGQLEGSYAVKVVQADDQLSPPVRRVPLNLIFRIL